MYLGLTFDRDQTIKALQMAIDNIRNGEVWSQQGYGTQSRPSCVLSKAASILGIQEMDDSDGLCVPYGLSLFRKAMDLKPQELSAISYYSVVNSDTGELLSYYDAFGRNTTCRGEHPTVDQLVAHMSKVLDHQFH